MRLTSEDEQQILKMVTGEEPLIPGDPNSRRAVLIN